VKTFWDIRKAKLDIKIHPGSERSLEGELLMRPNSIELHEYGNSSKRVSRERLLSELTKKTLVFILAFGLAATLPHAVAVRGPDIVRTAASVFSAGRNAMQLPSHDGMLLAVLLLYLCSWLGPMSFRRLKTRPMLSMKLAEA
jgi:hypothetical protein